MSSEELRELRERLETLRRRQRNPYGRVPEALREGFARWAHDRRGQGLTWDAIARETGVSSTTLLRWCRVHPSRGPDER